MITKRELTDDERASLEDAKASWIEAMEQRHFWMREDAERWKVIWNIVKHLPAKERQAILDDIQRGV